MGRSEVTPATRSRNVDDTWKWVETVGMKALFATLCLGFSILAGTFLLPTTNAYGQSGYELSRRGMGETSLKDPINSASATNRRVQISIEESTLSKGSRRAVTE